MNDPSFQAKKDALTADVQFGMDYKDAANNGCSPLSMREVICKALRRLGHPIGTIEMRERLRRHFDNWFDVDTSDASDQYNDLDFPTPKAAAGVFSSDDYVVTGSLNTYTTDTLTPMNTSNTTPFFANKFFLNGRDLALMSKQEIYNAISTKANAIRSLEMIHPRPAMLQQDIDAQKAELNALIAHLDGNTAPVGTGQTDNQAAA